MVNTGVNRMNQNIQQGTGSKQFMPSERKDQTGTQFNSSSDRAVKRAGSRCAHAEPDLLLALAWRVSISGVKSALHEFSG